MSPAPGVAEPVELAAIERGAGAAVVLIHGGAVHSGPAWAQTFPPLLEAGYRVLAVDRRGYGRSPAGSDGAADGTTGAGVIPVPLEAEDIAYTLDAREIATAHVVGVSYGALVGLELALAHPQRVVSLTLVEPPLVGWLDGDPDYGPWFARAVALENEAAAGAPAEEWLPGYLRLLDDEMARQLGPGGPVWPIVERALPRVRQETALTRYRPSADLEDLDMPVLIVNGGETEPPLQAVAELLAEEIRQAEHVEIDGVGHLVHALAPETFSATLVAFLAKAGGP